MGGKNYIQTGENSYRRKKWYEKHEMLAYSLLAIVFWAVVMAALFI